MKVFRRVMLSLFLAVAGVGIYLGVVGYFTFDRIREFSARATDRQETRMQSVTQFVAIAASEHLTAHELTRLGTFLNQISRGQDILFAGVVSPKGKVLAHTQPDVVGKTAKGAIPSQLPPEARLMETPITIGETVLGKVAIGFSLKGVQEAIEATRVETLFAGGLAAGVGSLILFPLIFGLVFIRMRLREIREMSEERRSILEEIEHGIIRVDTKGKISFLNLRVKELLQLPPEDWVGKSFAQLEPRLSWNITHEERLFEREVKLEDGSTRIILVNVTEATVSRGVRGYTLTLMDITEKKATEEEVERKNRQITLLTAMHSMIQHSLDSDRVVHQALNKVMDGLDSEAGWILLADPQEKTLKGVALKGLGAAGQVLQSGLSNGNSEYYRKIIEQGEPFSSDSIPKIHPLFEYLPPKRRMKSAGLTEIPLKSRDRVIGVLGLLGRKLSADSPEEQNFLSDLGRQIGSIIDHSLRFEETRKKVSILTQLQRASQSIAHISEWEDLLHAIVKNTVELLSAGRCALFLMDRQNNELAGAVGYGIWDEEVKVFQGNPSPLAYQAVSARKPIQVTPVTTAEKILDPYLERHDLKSVLLIPLVYRGKVLAIVYVDDMWSERVFTPEELSLAETFSRQAAISLWNSQKMASAKA